MIKCGHCGNQHGTVAEVRKCAGQPGGGVLVEEREPAGFSQAGFNPTGEASDAQKALLLSLLDEREMPESERQAWRDYLAGKGGVRSNKFGVTTAITRLKGYPRRAASGSEAVTQDGMYRNPAGEIFKVQWNRAGGDGRALYAKQLVLSVDGGNWKRIPMQEIMPEPANVEVRFEYVSGLIRRIKPEWRMTLEQAKKFGALYGVCCVCGRDLTDEISIAEGIGPICGKRV